jgi:hypothetical protein
LTPSVNDVSSGVNAVRTSHLYFSTGPRNQRSDFEAERKPVSYVNATLQAGERVTASASRHWIIYLRPLLWAAIGLCMIFASSKTSPTSDLATAAILGGFTILLIALISLIGRWFDNWTTELAVTDRRVIYKTGFIRRHTVEMNMAKIESVIVNQSILGRLLDFGTIHVKGTGQSIENLQSISCPLAVRDSITAR